MTFQICATNSANAPPSVVGRALRIRGVLEFKALRMAEGRETGGAQPAPRGARLLYRGKAYAAPSKRSWGGLNGTQAGRGDDYGGRHDPAWPMQGKAGARSQCEG